LDVATPLGAVVAVDDPAFVKMLGEGILTKSDSIELLD